MTAEESPVPESEAIQLPIQRRSLFDPPPELNWLLDNHPIRRLSYPDGHVGWLVTSYSLARSVLRDRRFSHRAEFGRPVVDLGEGAPSRWFSGRPAALPGYFLLMDPPEHTRYRRLLGGYFAARNMLELQPRIRQIVDARLDIMEASGPPIDFVEAFAMPVSLEVMCELFGVPEEDRWELHNNTEIDENLGSTPDEVGASWRAITELIRDLIEHKRVHPTGDVLSDLAKTSGFSDDELAGAVALLIAAGHQTTVTTMALGMFALLIHPVQLDALRSDPSLVPKAVEEMLRYLSVFIFGVARHALEDVELGGQTIRAGEGVQISLDAANRDPAKFDRPAEFDVSRDATGHLGFAHGVHQCIGQHLARIELKVAFRRLLRRFPSIHLAVPVQDVRLSDTDRLYTARDLPVGWSDSRR